MKVSIDELLEMLQAVEDERIFQIYEALKRGVSVDEI